MNRPYIKVKIIDVFYTKDADLLIRSRFPYLKADISNLKLTFSFANHVFEEIFDKLLSNLFDILFQSFVKIIERNFLTLYEKLSYRDKIKIWRIRRQRKVLSPKVWFFLRKKKLNFLEKLYKYLSKPEISKLEALKHLIYDFEEKLLISKEWVRLREKYIKEIQNVFSSFEKILEKEVNERFPSYIFGILDLIEYVHNTNNIVFILYYDPLYSLGNCAAFVSPTNPTHIFINMSAFKNVLYTLEHYKINLPHVNIIVKDTIEEFEKEFLKLLNKRKIRLNTLYMLFLKECEKLYNRILPLVREFILQHMYSFVNLLHIIFREILSQNTIWHEYTHVLQYLNKRHLANYYSVFPEVDWFIEGQAVLVENLIEYIKRHGPFFGYEFLSYIYNKIQFTYEDLRNITYILEWLDFLLQHYKNKKDNIYQVLTSAKHYYPDLTAFLSQHGNRIYYLLLYGIGALIVAHMFISGYLNRQLYQSSIQHFIRVIDYIINNALHPNIRPIAQWFVQHRISPRMLENFFKIF